MQTAAFTVRQTGRRTKAQFDAGCFRRWLELMLRCLSHLVHPPPAIQDAENHGCKQILPSLGVKKELVAIDEVAVW